MDIKSADIQVLQQTGTALLANDIVEKTMACSLWESNGKMQIATISARLYSNIKKQGRKSPFVKVGARTLALRDSSKKRKTKNTHATPAKAGQAPKTSSLNTGEQLLILLMKYSIGVHRSRPDLIGVSEEFLPGMK